MNIEDYRREYTRDGLDRAALPDDPLAFFDQWFRQATEAGVVEPNAMVLATVGEGGQPSQRTVLLKAFDRDGLVFFTNYTSRKSREIEANPRVCLLFPWIGLERQLIVEGRCERIPAARSLRYFLSRPRGSQIGAWVSQQSSVISSRKILEMKFEEMKRKFGEGKVPLPDFWGGYRVQPERYEFWQGRPNRLHDRFEYRLSGDLWLISRLSP